MIIKMTTNNRPQSVLNYSTYCWKVKKRGMLIINCFGQRLNARRTGSTVCSPLEEQSLGWVDVPLLVQKQSQRCGDVGLLPLSGGHCHGPFISCTTTTPTTASSLSLLVDTSTQYTLMLLTTEALADDSRSAAGQSQAAQVRQLLRLSGIVNTYGLFPLACGTAANSRGQKVGEV